MVNNVKDSIEYTASHLEELFSFTMSRKAMKNVKNGNQVLFSDIYDFVKASTFNEEKHKKVAMAISSKKSLMAQYRHLLSHERAIFVPVSAAAASVDENLMTRETEHFAIKAISSRHKNSHYYIILNLKSLEIKANNRSISLHVTKGDAFFCIRFPETQNNKTQVLVEHDDPLTQHVFNHDCELSLVFE